MTWLHNNWSLLVVIVAAIIVVFNYCKRFADLPSEAQQKKIKEWLLYAVLMAEKEYGQGTGKLKLASVYAEFLKIFPNIAPVVPFEVFSGWVDEVLKQMREILETNKDIEAYVEGLNK